MRHKTIFIIKSLAFLLFIVIFNSCGKDEPSPSPNLMNTISLSTKFLDLPKEATLENITLDAEGNWQIINEANAWVTLSPMEGNAGKGIVLQINVAENKTSNVRIAKILVKSVGSLIYDTLTIRQYGATPYVPINWDKDATISRLDLNTGTVDITFKDEVPIFTPGISSIVVPTDSLVYIRVVNEVQSKGNHVSLRTTEGDMTNIFMNQEFTLSTIPLEKISFSRSGNINTTDSKGVIHPVRISTRSEEGFNVVLYDAENVSLQRNMDIDKNLRFFYYQKDFSGKKLYDKGGVTLQWDKCIFESALDGQFHFSFADTMEVLNESLVVPKGELLTFFYLLKGSIDFDMLLHMIAVNDFNGVTSEPVEVMKDVLGKNGIHIDFIVGNVPVRIIVKADILGDASITSKMRCDLTGGLHTGLTLSCGLSYYGKDNGFRAEKGVDPHFTLYKPEIKVKGKMDVNASIYPEISVMLYNFAGPTVKVIPTIGDEIQYGGHAGGESEKYASWTNRFYTFINATGQLNLNFIGKTVSSPELSLMDEFQKDIYRTPEHIVFTENNVKACVDQPVSVTVKVTDYSALQDDSPLSTGTVVKFEPTEGIVNHEFAMTGIDGTATVTYIPASERSFLKAKIMTADGKEIDSDILYPSFDNKINLVGVWRVLRGITGDKNIDNIRFYPDGKYEYVYYYNPIQHGEVYDGFEILDGNAGGTYLLHDIILTDHHDYLGKIDFGSTFYQDNSIEYIKQPNGTYIQKPISMKDYWNPELYLLFGRDGTYRIQVEASEIDEYGNPKEISLWNYAGQHDVIALKRVSEDPNAEITETYLDDFL